MRCNIQAPGVSIILESGLTSSHTLPPSSALKHAQRPQPTLSEVTLSKDTPEEFPEPPEINNVAETKISSVTSDYIWQMRPQTKTGGRKMPPFLVVKFYLEFFSVL